MVVWVDVPDTDWSDFRRQRAVDISSYTNQTQNGDTSQMEAMSLTQLTVLMPPS